MCSQERFNICLLLPGVLVCSQERFELTGLCVGEAFTVFRGTMPFPALRGVAINVKTGIVFPASFSHRGPDMDLRLDLFSLYRNC